MDGCLKGIVEKDRFGTLRVGRQGFWGVTWPSPAPRSLRCEVLARCLTKTARTGWEVKRKESKYCPTLTQRWVERSSSFELMKKRRIHCFDACGEQGHGRTLKSSLAFEGVCVSILKPWVMTNTHRLSIHTDCGHWGTTPRNILAAECTNNYQHVPPVMTVCVMGDTNIGTVISQVLKLAMTRSRMLFLPKQRGRHLLALPRHSQSMSKVPPLFDTAVCCFWIKGGEEEEER